MIIILSILFLSMLACPANAQAARPTGPTKVDIGLSATSMAGAELEASVETGTLRCLAYWSLPWDWEPLSGAAIFPDGLPASGFSLSTPGLLAGGADTASASFLYRPCSGGTALAGETRPFRQAKPRDAAATVGMLGNAIGAFFAMPSDDTERTAFGAWFSPAAVPIRAVMMASREPGEPGGPSWFDPPEAADWRLWASLAYAFGEAMPYMRIAVAGSMGFPGPDAWAARAEAACRLGAFSLSTTGAFASAEWRGPDGGRGPGYRLAGDLSWKKGTIVTTLAYRAEADWDGEPPQSTARAGVDLDCAAMRLGSSASLDFDGEATAPALAIDGSASPGSWTWLTVSGRWRARDGRTERAEGSIKVSTAGLLSAQAALSAGLDGGGGAYLKGSCSLSYDGGSWSSSAGVRVRDEFRAGGEGELELFCSMKCRIR